MIEDPPFGSDEDRVDVVDAADQRASSSRGVATAGSPGRRATGSRSTAVIVSGLVVVVIVVLGGLLVRRDEPAADVSTTPTASVAAPDTTPTAGPFFPGWVPDDLLPYIPPSADGDCKPPVPDTAASNEGRTGVTYYGAPLESWSEQPGTSPFVMLMLVGKGLAEDTPTGGFPPSETVGPQTSVDGSTPGSVISSSESSSRYWSIDEDRMAVAIGRNVSAETLASIAAGSTVTDRHLTVAPSTLGDALALLAYSDDISDRDVVGGSPPLVDCSNVGGARQLTVDQIAFVAPYSPGRSPSKARRLVRLAAARDRHSAQLLLAAARISPEARPTTINGRRGIVGSRFDELAAALGLPDTNGLTYVIEDARWGAIVVSAIGVDDDEVSRLVQSIKPVGRADLDARLYRARIFSVIARGFRVDEVYDMHLLNELQPGAAGSQVAVAKGTPALSNSDHEEEMLFTVGVSADGTVNPTGSSTTMMIRGPSLVTRYDAQVTGYVSKEAARVELRSSDLPTVSIVPVAPAGDWSYRFVATDDVTGKDLIAIVYDGAGNQIDQISVEDNSSGLPVSSSPPSR